MRWLPDNPLCRWAQRMFFITIWSYSYWCLTNINSEYELTLNSVSTLINFRNKLMLLTSIRVVDPKIGASQLMLVTLIGLSGCTHVSTGWSTPASSVSHLKHPENVAIQIVWYNNDESLTDPFISGFSCIIHCSITGFITPKQTELRRTACDMALVSPSARFLWLRTKTLSEMSLTNSCNI